MNLLLLLEAKEVCGSNFSCSLFSQVTSRALFIISKSGRSNPPLSFGPIIVVCLILGFVFHTNSEIAVLTDAANYKGKVSTDVL